MLRRWKQSMTALTLAVLCSLMLASAAFANPTADSSLVGVKKHYLALGDSLAFGYQPDFDFGHSYSHYLGNDLKELGGKYTANMSCPGETTQTMIHGKCKYSFLRKFPYVGSQLDAALIYLSAFKGKVSPVTITIGANDVLPNLDEETCAIDQNGYTTALAQMGANLQQVILPKLREALTVDGVVTGDIILMNYYNPYQNVCPESLPFTQTLNQQLVQAAQGYATVVDVFSAYGGEITPNPTICTHTWMCSVHKDIHANDLGQRTTADAIKATTYWA